MIPAETAARSDPARASHALDVLLAEHRALDGLAAALGREAARVRIGLVPRRLWLRDVIEVLEDFADRCHGDKEEALLFPALLRHGLRGTAGPIASLRRERRESRALVARLHVALQRADAPALADALAACVRQLRRHVDREELELFPDARAVLGTAELCQLAAWFDEFDREVVGVDEHRRLLEQTRALAGASAAGRDEPRAGGGAAGGPAAPRPQRGAARSAWRSTASSTTCGRISSWQYGCLSHRGR
jgi:hemerythrin-like domain-containing protein